jgi:hypothetical protein
MSPRDEHVDGSLPAVREIGTVSASPREPVLLWILCDTELLEAHAVERHEAAAFLQERMSELSDDEVTRTVHPVGWSVVYRGRLKDGRPGYLQAYEVPFAAGSIEVREFVERSPRVTFGSESTGRVWTCRVPGFRRLHDGHWDRTDRDRWLAAVGFAPATGTSWDFVQQDDGTLVAEAWAGVVRLELAS